MNKNKKQKPTRRIPRWVFVVFGVVVIGGGVTVGARVMMKSRITAPVVSAVTTPMVRRAIDGVLVAEGTKEAYPFAVVIENSVDAWPLSGIGAANLVWEAPAEAGIPRLLAVFADGSDVKEIGPVRSARPYFVDWTEEFHGLFGHVGGSPEALALLPSRDVFDVNEFSRGQFFWRSRARSAPHNVYTSSQKLQEVITRYQLPITNYQSGKYKDDAVRDARGAMHDIVIEWGA